MSTSSRPRIPPSSSKLRHQLNSHILQHPAPQRTEVGGVEEGLELLQVASCGRWRWMAADGRRHREKGRIFSIY